jgi:hypothetical protein
MLVGPTMLLIVVPALKMIFLSGETASPPNLESE